MYHSSPIATGFCSFKTAQALVCVLIKFIQNIPVSFSSVFTSTCKIPHASACFTRNSNLLPELCTGISRNVLPSNLSFTWRPYNKAGCLGHSLSSISVALKVFSSLAAPTSFGILVQGKPAGPVMHCMENSLLTSGILTSQLGVRGNLYKEKRTMRQDVKTASQSVSHNYQTFGTSHKAAECNQL